MSISSEVWETPLRFLGTDDLGRVEVCSLDMLEQCRHCWQQKRQHVGQLLATTIKEDLAETSPDLKRGLRQLFACLQDGLTDLSKLQRLQLQTSDIICLGQKLSTMKCLQGTVKMLKCLTMAKRQRKRSLARGSTAIHVGEEVLELQVEWFDTSVFLRLTSLQTDSEVEKTLAAKAFVIRVLHISSMPFVHTPSLSMKADAKWQEAGFSQGLLKVGKDEFIKSLLRGFLSVIIVETSQRQRGSDHGSGSVAALHLDRLGCDDLYKQRAEMFAR